MVIFYCSRLGFHFFSPRRPGENKCTTWSLSFIFWRWLAINGQVPLPCHCVSRENHRTYQLNLCRNLATISSFQLVDAPHIILSSSYEKLLIYVHIRHRMILLFVHNLLTCQSKFLKALSRFEREVHAFNNKANNVM